MRTHRNHAHTFLFSNSDDLKHWLTQFEAPSASNAFGLNPLLDLSSAGLRISLPGQHLLQGIGGETDLRTQFHHVQKYNFLNSQRLQLVQTLGQLLRLRGEVRGNKRP